MTKKIFISFGIISLALAGMLLTAPKHAHAAFTWCDVLAPANDNSGNNCLAGVTENALNGVNTKSEIIAAINKFNGYGGYQRIGAQYIMCGLEGKNQGCSPGTDWETRINNPAVTVGVDSSYPTCTNSAYDQSSRSVVTYTECGNYNAFVFKVNGVVKYAIKTDCGNPLGVLAGLPPYTPNQAPSGAISVGCNTDGTGKFSGWFYDPQGATTARVTGGSGGGITPQTFSSGSGQKTYATRKTFSVSSISATHTRGTWTLTMVVQDNGGNLDKTYRASHAQCNRVPTGSVTSAYCTLLSGSARDPDSSNQLTIRYDVYRADTDALLKQGAGGLDATSGSGHTFSVNPLSSFNNAFGGWQAIRVRVYARDVNTGTYELIGNKVIAPCVDATCTTDFAGTVPVGTKDTFQVDMRMLNVNSPSGAVTGYGFNPNSAGAKFGVKVKNPGGGNVALQTASGVAFDPNSNFSYAYPTGSRNGLNFMVTQAGTYTMNASLTVPGNRGGSSISFSGCGGASGVTLQAGYQPYFDVLGGDIAAGPGFGASCTQGDSSDITGVLDTASSSPSGYYGAGAQLAALALGDISHFATSLNEDGSGSGSTPPKGLTFANTTGGGAIYGGNYGKPAWCVPDYVSKALEAPNISTTLDVTKSGTYHLTGNQTIGNITLVKGKRVTIVVTGGDVFIDGNIKYNTSYASTQDIPQLQLLVQGNIYIQNDVRELHGFYAAQPKTNGSAGKLYTCATALDVPVTGSDKANDYNTCKHQLSVYGGVAAKQLILGRTYGTVAGNGSPAAPAEQFVYVPELWLGDLTVPRDSSEPYQAFTSLPPIL